MKTILLIDDERLVLKSFGAALRRQGYNVLEAACGTDGFDMARKHLPDLILSDINMPRGDGSSLLQNIRRDPELRHKQVVLMTGRPDLVTPRKGMEDGADAFLSKPLSEEALLECLETRLNRASVNWRVGDEKLSQLRSSVPPNLPHEFFTPMAGIIGLTEMLRSDASELSSEEVSEIHNEVHSSAVRLNRTLRNYLQILDLEKHSPEVVLAPLSPRQVEESIHAGGKDALERNKRREDVTFRINVCSIVARSEDVRRIVEELIDNACKFSRQGTPVTLELDAIGRMTVTDQGKGLLPEEISQIGAFQQFNREKYEQQGLGVGLVLVQKLAAQCKATFSITSQPGKGTQVQIVFPTSRLA
jgi:signal transduction histidine kinase